MCVRAGEFDIRLEGLSEGWQGRLSVQEAQHRLCFVRLRLQSPKPQKPPQARLAWQMPMVDVHARWCTGIGPDRHIPPDFSGPFAPRANSGAPVMSVYSATGRNRLTFALSDPMNSVQMKAHVSEEAAALTCFIELFVEPHPAITDYEAVLRLDTRNIPYYQALNEVSKWWADLPGCEPSPTPEAARLAVYSTWYSFHQQLDPIEVENQCRLSKQLGCGAVIVDDGWQTTDSSRSYEHCGDWEPLRIPDMEGHVARIHDLGMKFVLWYALPFVGVQSRNWAAFEDRFLSVSRGRHRVGTLDPRFPDVREHLIQVLESAMLRWNLDGFKLDFIDSFRLPADKMDDLGGGRDYDCVPEAVDRLLSDILTRLRRIKPDTMIEFRQSYVGPLMRNYGNMFRAGDCPNDALSNRVRTIDIRQLCGDTACHSDMLMWHPADRVESAALQIINVLFSVPQISVLLDRLPSEHLEMLRFWLSFWQENRSTLIDGELIPMHPELLYPVVLAKNSAKLIAACYSDHVVSLDGHAPDELVLVNGKLTDRIALETGADLGERDLEVRDCTGRITASGRFRLNAGLNTILVPPAGVVRLFQQ